MKRTGHGLIESVRNLRVNLNRLPFLLKVNHGNGPYVGPSDKAFWAKKSVGFFNAQKPIVWMQPRRAYSAGQQITMDYGAEKSNGELALDYGFVVDGGIGEGTRDKFQLTLEIPEEDRFIDDKVGECLLFFASF